MPSPKPIKLFYSYSHKDEKLRDQLAIHLTMLQHQDVIQAWHDRNINAGSEWAEEIDANLNAAQIILLLISADFLASDYCYSLEMRRAIARHEAGEACVIPIILKPVDWSGAPFGRLQALPKNAKPVTRWSNRDQAFVDIAQGIRKTAQAILEQQSSLPESSELSESSESSAIKSTIDHNSLSAESDSSGLSVSGLNSSHAERPCLENPEGSVPLNSLLYIERPPIEDTCYQEVSKPGALIRVKAPRQMGKSSLVQRILHRAEQQGHCTAYLNLQSLDAEVLNTIDPFLQSLCASVANELMMDDRLPELWQGVVGSKNKCTNYFQRYLLATLKAPLTLGLDEVDQVFHHLQVAQDFFGLLRSWHEKSKNDATWQRFRLVIAHSREVYIPLNINHSPFNVGLPIELPALTPVQVRELVQRHSLSWSVSDIDYLFELVDGHPYLVRKALYEIACGRLTLTQFLAIAPTEEGPYSDHLRRQLENLNHDPPLAAAMQQVVTRDRPVRVESSLGFKLHSMGLVRRQGNDILPLCNLYRIYLRDRLEVG